MARLDLEVARAQLDVLHARPGLVESARGPEHRPPDGPTAGPERASLARSVLMDIVVQQVLVETGRIACRGTVVVTAEDRCHVGLAREKRLHASEGIRMHRHVGVDEDQHLAGGCLGPAVARMRRAARAGRGRQHARGESSRQRSRTISRAVVNHDDFVGRARRGRQCLQAESQTLAAVVDRNHNRESHRLLFRCPCRIHDGWSPDVPRAGGRAPVTARPMTPNSSGVTQPSKKSRPP